jgi:hypothetical protein
MAIPPPKSVRRRRVNLLFLVLLLPLVLAAYLWLLTDNGPITLANYNRIPEGLTLEAAVKILGEPGEWRPVYSKGERPWNYAIWTTKDGGRTICLAISERGIVLWKWYRDDTLMNKALRSVGVNAPPREKVTTVKAP